MHQTSEIARPRLRHVSSHGQSLDTQNGKLTAFGCEKVFQKKRSGASRDKREAVNAALEFCREGDVPVITKLDRLARSMFDLQDITKTLDRKRVEFIVLDQSIETTTPASRLTFHLLGAVAEFERDLKRGGIRGLARRADAETAFVGRKYFDGSLGHLSANSRIRLPGNGHGISLTMQREMAGEE